MHWRQIVSDITLNSHARRVEDRLQTKHGRSRPRACELSVMSLTICRQCMPTRIVRAGIQNLLINAAKYAGSGGVVRVRAERSNLRSAS